MSSKYSDFDDIDDIQFQIACQESLTINQKERKPSVEGIDEFEESQYLAFFTDTKVQTTNKNNFPPRSNQDNDRLPKSESKPSSQHSNITAKSSSKKEDSKLNKKDDSKSSNTSFFGVRIPGSIVTSNVNQCPGCKQTCVTGKILSAMNATYHADCFRCKGCSGVITGQYAQHGMPLAPYHPQCGVDVFNPRCTLCCQSISSKFFRHPFFDQEIYCVSHENSTSCFSCNRKEPLVGSKRDSFVSLPDGRSLCFDCSSSVIMESSEVQAIYAKIVDFMEHWLGLPLPAGMRNVPVLAVDLLALNESKSQQTAGSCGSGSTVRGLTMSTCGEIRHMTSGSVVYDSQSDSYHVVASAPQVLKIEEVRDVTAVLVLYGLPEELTSSIVAHEAMHVWLKLTKSMPFLLPAKVEEGLCQVVAHRYLKEIGQQKTTGPRDVMSDREYEVWQKEEELRAYLTHQIATDPSEAYGDGFREASVCVEALGLQVVIDCIRDTKTMPSV